MTADFFDLQKGRRNTQSQVQDLRRRMNQRPAIHEAKATADDGVSRGSAAQQRADEAHSRFTNTALDAAHLRADAAHGRATNPAIDAAHARAEAAYRQDGSDAALIFKSDRAVGATQAAFLRHAPPDGDSISFAQQADGSLFVFNDTTAKMILRIDRNGNVAAPSGSLRAAGGIEPNFDGGAVRIDGGTGVVMNHNFNSYPNLTNAWVTVGVDIRAPLPRDNVFVDWISKTQIRIANTNAAGIFKTVGCHLFK